MGNLELFIPEATILAGAILVFTISVMGGSQRAGWIASVVMAAAGVAMSIVYVYADGEPFFPGIYRVDAFSQLLKVGITVGLLLTVLVSGRAESFRARTRADMPMFMFFAATGMMMLVSATELLTLYVALELSAYGLYILAVLHTSQREGAEAGAKYVLFGAASSAMTLYGVSLIYAAATTTYLSEIAQQPVTPLMVVGVLLALTGVFFKLAVFPFHAWAPDVYEASPHQAATFIGTASKVAAIGIIIRLMFLVGQGHAALTNVFLILCVASMTVGNLAAIVQHDLKRLLAYSTVAHAGYIMIGLACFSTAGVASAIFYGLLYVPVVFCAFLVVCVLGSDGRNPSKASLAGLYRRSPLLAFTLLVGMFGLAGIPPTAGFAGKWFLFSAAIERDLFWLVLIGALNATVSLYYYLLVIKEAYLTPPVDESPIAVSFATTVAAWLGIALVLFVGFYPGPLWVLAESAARAITGG
ncbi:MAG: NADH-quinone oxidoreductase subunit N [Planctomycetes bacterium]|nr:NADH-quinone oxidoreductase subunit N [Planctomycetota bacterium]